MHLLASVLALAAVPGALAGLYPKSSPVLQVDAKSYDRLIAKSNYTSIVEFYAPWCGHCQNLKPAYEKAATSLDGLAKVASVDCDDDANKPLCGQFGIQGFPTLKIVRPGKKPGKPTVEDYQGPRSAVGIVEAVQDKINNHVKKVTDKDIDTFFSDDDTPKALLFTEKGTTSSLLKSIAIDFLDVVTVGQVRNTQKEVVDKFGIGSFPTLVLLPANGGDPVVYDGALKKTPMVEFISQLGSPNPDPAPGTSNKKAEKKPAPDAKDDASPEAAPENDTSDEPTASPVAAAVPPIPSIGAAQALQTECFAPKSHTCVLAFVPSGEGNSAKQSLLSSLAEISHKHAQSGRHLFPFYEIPEENDSTIPIRATLDLTADIELVAVNARRGWFRHYQGDHDVHSVESWIDAIRMGEGEKKSLPAELVIDPESAKETPAAVSEEKEEPSAGTVAHAPEPETEAPIEEPSEVPAEQDAAETPVKHEEL